MPTAAPGTNTEDALRPPGARFLEAIEAQAQLPAHVQPVEAAVACMAALLERLTPGQAHRLVASLPDGVRTYFEQAERHRDGRPVVKVGRAELLASLSEQLGVTPASAESILVAVFDVVRGLVAADVSSNVATQLPADLQQVWIGASLAAQAESTHAAESAETDLGVRRHVLRRIGEALDPAWGITPAEAFSAVMCPFARRLSGGEAEDLLLVLPRALQPLVARCFRHRETEVAKFDLDDLVGGVAEHLDAPPEAARRLVLTIFDAVREVVPADEIENAASQLPSDLRAVWTGSL